MIHHEPRPDACVSHSSEDDEEDFVVVQVNNHLEELISFEHNAHIEELTELTTDLNTSPDPDSVNDSMRRVTTALTELARIRQLLGKQSDGKVTT
tara:strand:+ start:10302 stop:10586 length:285 start_codon:yes stop_codon:yes gene_type:complete